MKISSPIIEFKLSCVRVIPLQEVGLETSLSNNACAGLNNGLDIEISPPIHSSIIDKLLKAEEIEVVDGRLVGFSTISSDEYGPILRHWHVEGGRWIGEENDPVDL